MTDQTTTGPRHFQPTAGTPPAPPAPAPEHQRTCYHGSADDSGYRYMLMDAGDAPSPWARFAVRELDRNRDSPTGVLHDCPAVSRYFARVAYGGVPCNDRWVDAVSGEFAPASLVAAVLSPVYTAWGIRQTFAPMWDADADADSHPLWRDASDKEIHGYDRPTD